MSDMKDIMNDVIMGTTMQVDPFTQQAESEAEKSTHEEVKALRFALQKALDENEALRITIRELETVVKELKNSRQGTTYSYE